MADATTDNTNEQLKSSNLESNNVAIEHSDQKVDKNEIRTAAETENLEKPSPDKMGDNSENVNTEPKNGGNLENTNLNPTNNQVTDETTNNSEAGISNKDSSGGVTETLQKLDTDVADSEDVIKWTEEMEKIDEGSPQKGAKFMNCHYANNSDSAEQTSEISKEQKPQTNETEASNSAVQNVNNVTKEQGQSMEECKITDNETSQSVNNEEGMDNTNKQTVNDCTKEDTDANTTDKSTPMSLDQIQSMLNTINSDISLLKDNATIGETENTKSRADGNFDDLRMRNDQIRQELLSIKKDQEMRMTLQPASVEHKIIESSKKNKLKDCTRSLEEEIEIINKARKAQASLKQRQEERRLAAIKKQRGEQSNDGKDVTVTEIRTSIRLLKEEMEKISNFPISEIVPEDPSELVPAETTEDGNTESDSGKPAEGKPKSKNAKAHDEMLRKYLMMNVMRQNVQVLTAKMNEIMKSQGVEPAKPGEILQEKSSNAAENKVNDDGENNDDYYVYDDQEEHSDLYEEANEDENDTEENKGESNENQNQKESVLEAAAKSIAKVEAVIYKDKENSETGAEQPKAQLSKSQKKKLKKRQNAQANGVTQNNKTTDKTESKELADDEPLMSPGKMRAYNLLLKLQREMAGMQIQVTKLQDNMRAANAALNEVLESEFSDI